MTTIHVISDLFLGFNEFSTEDENIPDVDLVILNGNIGHIKRSMLYAETLCKKYPSTQFVCNLGETELYYSVNKSLNETRSALEFRKNSNATWPNNLHYNYLESKIITLRNGYKFDIMCAYGFPKIYSYNIDWNETVWAKKYPMKIESNDNWNNIYKPKEVSNVKLGEIGIFATKDWINEEHEKEWLIVKKWEIAQTEYKILITHINPYKDSRCENQSVAPYNIHLDKGIWISSNVKNNGLLLLGGRLYSNPGRGLEARSNVIRIN